MAIKKVYKLHLDFVGDGSTTTYAVNLSTDTVQIVNDGPANRQMQNSVWPWTPVPTACLAGTTAGGVAFTGGMASSTLTITFGSAPPAGPDSLIAVLTA